MITLEKVYKNIANKPTLFKYYRDSNNILNLIDVLDGEVPASSFIKTYFEMGKKGIFAKTISDITKFNIVDNRNDRDLHTVSVFILGIAIAEKLGSRIKENDLFIWFLMCLYHDKGYFFELNENNIDIKLPDNLNDFISFFHQHYFDDFFSNDDDFRELCENYYEYRIKEKKIIDHGIAGGLLLYYVLVDNYYDLQNSLSTKSDNFYISGRFFSNKYFDDYKHAAKGIMRHNMWYASNEDKIKIYKKYKLDRLISVKNNKISFGEDRLLFLLCLSDTIEPLKKTLGENSSNLLSEILMEVRKGSLKLKFTKDFENRYDYIRSIMQLQDWMNVECTLEYNHTMMTVSIDFQ